MKFQRNVSLKKFTTFRTGGKARYFVEVRSEKELVEAVNFAKLKGLEIFVIGGGSNILVSDKDFNALFLKFSGKKIFFKNLNSKFVFVKAKAGVEWDDLVKKCVSKNLQGIELMSGIPGSVGASPVQNIGAYGQELKDTFVELKAYDLKLGKFRIFRKKDCRFSYRESIFKKKKNWGRFIIVEVTLKLKRDSLPKINYDSLVKYLEEKKIFNLTLKKLRKAVLYLRRKKLEDPKIYGNAGSFFKNPVVDEIVLKRLLKHFPEMPYVKKENRGYKIFAGWLIDKLGWKGKNLGGAMVSDKNALVILNKKNATSEEIKTLADKIRNDVYKKFNVLLEYEVQTIGL